MRKLFALIFVVLVSLWYLPFVNSSPYWFHEGAYVKYALLSPGGKDNEKANIFEVYPPLIPSSARKKLLAIEEVSEDEPASIFVRGDVFLTFRVVSIKNDSAKINITLELNDAWVYNRHRIGVLKLSRVLLLNRSDMRYYDENGAAFGRPIFFMNPLSPPRRDELWMNVSPLVKLGISTKDLVVKNVSYSWMADKTLHTYYRDFVSPYIYIESNRAPFFWKLPDGYISGSLHIGAVYDFDTGIMLTSVFTKSSPELLSLGIVLGSDYDYQAGEKLSKLFDEEKSDREWWQPGFNLYDTNIKFPEYNVSDSESTPSKYFFLAALLALLISALIGWRCRGE
ncbi:hypothetical protein A3L11_01705 [Thermococcus siculi]|uniref:Uncharacterized protein n=1 Tax=Thermococcus siculi TaxID=72803 RepID=A0A2Z2MI10_9EURY|nr:hypothetical protein [Thermococcus siculi]ASJ08009.1 hypothetical protein A3L11_01705 [Thermococcus siculi]